MNANYRYNKRRMSIFGSAQRKVLQHRSAILGSFGQIFNGRSSGDEV
jgi:hypothetical protein